MAKNDNHHLAQMRFPQSTMEEIRFLKNHYGLTNRTELLRRLIRKEYKLVQEMEDGDDLVIRKPDGRETKILIL